MSDITRRSFLAASISAIVGLSSGANALAGRRRRLCCCPQVCIPQPGLSQISQSNVKSEFGHPVRTLAKGDSGENVVFLHQYLARFGYLPNPEQERMLSYSPAVNAKPNNPASFDHATEEAVKALQWFYSLKEDGKLNEETLSLMKTPRCGNPDAVPKNRSMKRLQYVLNGKKWKQDRLSYNIVFPFPKFVFTSIKDYQQAATAAAISWNGAGAKIELYRDLKSDLPDQVDIPIGFYLTSTHAGCGAIFKGETAHARFTSTGSIEKWGIHCDGRLSWSTSTPATAMDAQSVLLHEIGHVLGLDHCSNPANVMYAYLNATEIKRKLTFDEMDGVRQIYGSK